MNDQLRHPIKPFGEPSCEAELEALLDDYEDYYFDPVPFNDEALDPRHYLIVGRRGSGKTSLTHFFKFQTAYPNARCVDVDEPELFEHLVYELTRHAAESYAATMERLSRLWDWIIWCLTFNALGLAEGYLDLPAEASASQVAKASLDAVFSTYEPEAHFYPRLQALLESDDFRLRQMEALERLPGQPVFVAIDSLEGVRSEHSGETTAVAAMIQSASGFQQRYSPSGLHVKAFVGAEPFPYLIENVLSNPAKYVRDPLHLHWRPKDLLRLVCWRFFLHLKQRGLLAAIDSSDIDWEDFQDVKKRMWVPYFGAQVKNGSGRQEDTFTYILRHTQMRPRQLILLCNLIAQRAIDNQTFPEFSQVDLRDSIQEIEVALSDEVINAYSRVVENVGFILDALAGMPMIFSGSRLDKVAPKTADQWISHPYSPHAFRRLVAETGIVGRVRSKSETAGIVEADFEYNLNDRLILSESDECVIHPMFFRKFNIDTEPGLRILPFPGHVMEQQEV